MSTLLPYVKVQFDMYAKIFKKYLLLFVSLFAACLFRYNLLSLIYFVYLLLLPWFQCPNKHTIKGHTGNFIRAVFFTSLVFVLAHICFQTVLYTYPPLSLALGHNCSQWDVISRHIGLSRLPLDEYLIVLRLVCPDLGVFAVSLVTIIVCNRLVKNRETVSAANITSVSHFLLAHARITMPSAFTAIYFLLFICLCTWWAFHLPISHLGFNALCVMLSFFTSGHMVCLYLYQSVLAQALFPPPSLWARLFGLKDIIQPGNCSSPYDMTLNVSYEWPVYVSPGILFLLYITLAAVLKTESYGKANQVNLMRLFSLHQYVMPLRCLRSGQVITGTLVVYWIIEEHLVVIVLLLTRRSRHHTQKFWRESLSEWDSLVMVSLFLTGGSCHPPRESPFSLLGRVIMQQSYVCALIAMMVWSIMYHSWLTFVLLLWACLIWILRTRRQAATLCSPFILLYGLALCCLQYIWAIELQPELPTTLGTMRLNQLGLDRAKYPCLRLGAMVRRDKEYFYIPHVSLSNPFLKGEKEPVLKVVGALVMSCYAKYWIFVCGGMFIMVSFAGKLVGYKIVYMLMFLICLCLYQVCYSLWRRLLKLFWWLVVAYTMLVLISIYTYQFEDFPGYWRNFTGFTEQQLEAIGLETFALSELFTSILIPGFFLLACILQLHYFHKPFMRITDLEDVTPLPRYRCILPGPLSLLANDGLFIMYLLVYLTSIRKEKKFLRTELPHSDDEEEELVVSNEDSDDEGKSKLTPSKWGLVMDRLLVLSRRFSDTLTKVQEFVWRLLELHIAKMVALFAVWVALEEPSLMNLVLVVLWTLAMPYSAFRPMTSCLSTVWVCVIIVCKMLYQLSVVNPVEYSSNCTKPLSNETNLSPEEILDSSLYKEPVDPARWFGIRKDATILGYSQSHLLLLMMLVFEATVYRHQAHHYRQLQKSPPTIPTLFATATRDTLDQGLIPCLKYLLNYTFYKFGLEICFLMMVNVIGQRMNFLMIIHGCWLVVILSKRRRAAIARVWPSYCVFLSVFMIYQYLLCLGIPPALCIEYPWRWKTPVLINSALIKWIYLPDFYTVPNSRNLIADFVLLMCASQQWKVFECERTREWTVLAGENVDDPEHVDGRLCNPAANFINCRSYLDMAKVLVFRHLFWFVLSVVFITGATRISVFGLGYLLACFFFLLFGTHFLVKPCRTRLNLWDCLIIYNVAVIISKNMLSILACVFVSAMQNGFCWVIQLFSLVCTVNGYYDPVNDKNCSLPVGEAGILWDSICFFFLLLQRRVFLSFYFLHVVAELQASAKQASRVLLDSAVAESLLLSPTSPFLSLPVCLCEAHGEMVQRILDLLHFLWAIVLAMVDGMTLWLNLLTKQYREMSVVLCNERYFITHKIQQVSTSASNSKLALCDLFSCLEVCSGELTEQSPPTASAISRKSFIEELEDSRSFFKSQNRLLKLLFALYNLLAANSEVACYLIIVLNNMVTASVISLILPILVFLWAMLSVPRPTKRFWMTAIVYTEVMVVVKYFFQFGFFPWNSAYEMAVNDDKPFFPPRILGLEKTDNYIRYDLLQLLALFFHRSLLKGPLEEQSPTPVSCIDEMRCYDVSGCCSRYQDSYVVCYTLTGHFIRIQRVYRPAKCFFGSILRAEYRAPTDVYALMFLTDVVDFIVIIFGFWAFGKHSAAADIASTLSDDQVPEAFLAMLLIQFSTMIIDRALYLRKAVLGKLIFQVILVFGIHLWMFFILPAVTERMFNQNFVAQLWYFVKCIYFGLSALQIRCGYPTRILGNFLTKNYNHLNLFLFQGFRLVPFLVELRAVMDWVWTDTTLSLSNWMCVEDIYANIFIIKCSRETEKKYPQPKGQKKKKIVKYGMGGLIIFFLICIIWFPLLFISLVRSVVGVVNHPIDVTVTIKLGGYEPLFTMSVQQQSIQPFTMVEYEQLTKKFGNNAAAMQFITLYNYEDIVTAMIEGSSGSVWRISPPSRQEVIKELLSSRSLWSQGTPSGLIWPRCCSAIVPSRCRLSLCVFMDVDTLQRGKYNVRSLVCLSHVPNLFPNYLRAPNGAEAKPVSQLFKEDFLNITLSLKSDRSLNGGVNQEWWDIAIEGCAPSSCGVLPMVIFNDKVSPPSLGFLAGYGIMGLYVSVVLVIGKFVRGFFSEISHSIMFEELPCVDRILKLCTDIFLVRETGELELEEELYSKLIFLYRSPETMIKWTRDINAQDQNPGI
uniref:Piezo type mechanosensitive ion channel component 1 (Er blood group) n=1 Tax=Takifugu rubripes TaxID=31033 RepID=A0A674MJI0_TAKRU